VTSLKDALRQFTRMYRPHEAREDTVLFPSLRTVVSKHEFDALGEDFEKKEHQLFGEDGFERMVERVAGIERTLGIYDLAQFTPREAGFRMRRFLGVHCSARDHSDSFAVATVFATEGIQSPVPDATGSRLLCADRDPGDVMAPSVGVVEIVGGLLAFMGLWTRPAALALLVNISVAIISTKLPILLGHGIWGFQLPKLESYGWWSAIHEARTDLSMWLGCLYLLIVGAGAWSSDARLSQRYTRQR